MIWTIILLIISFAIGVMATLDRLCSKEWRKIISALIMLVLLATSLSIKCYLDLVEYHKNESEKFFSDHEEREIDEASGGTFLGDYAYLVDDEVKKIFRFKWKEGSKKMDLLKKIPLLGNKPTPTPKLVYPEEADDFEGIASYSDHLYLITSHSREKGGFAPERQFFLEVGGPFDEVAKISAYRDLKSLLETYLTDQKNAIGGELSCEIIDMEIEGLAIDGEGCVYIGFRKPQLEFDNQKYSIVIQSPVSSLLDPNADPLFELFILDFKPRPRGPEEGRGIVSLEWDHQTKSILILTNNPEKEVYTDPTTLWKWDPNSQMQHQEPTKIKELCLPEIFRAKGEALVAPPDSRDLFVFIDSEGYGGQRKFNRKEIGLDK
jgi:hypothetical protein